MQHLNDEDDSTEKNAALEKNMNEEDEQYFKKNDKRFTFYRYG